MDVKTGGSLIHGIFCTLAGILFIGFFIAAGVGPAWWSLDHDLRFDSWADWVLLVLGFALLFQIVLGVWVGIDANRRGMNGFLWGALTCFTCVVGFLVYLLTAQSRAGEAEPVSPPAAGRSPEPGTIACRDCGAPGRSDYLACPHCGSTLARKCPSCATPVEQDWSYCSRCSADLKADRAGS